MSDRFEDRHKTPRVYKSGFEKIKEKKEKQKKDDALLSKTRRMTDFLRTDSKEDSDKLNVLTSTAVTIKNDTDDAVEKEGVITEEKNLLPSDTLNENCRQNNFDDECLCDISLWPNRAEKYINYWLNRGSMEIQNNNSKILDSKSFVQKDGNSFRKCKLSMFEKIIKNGDSVKRSWLCFSPITGKLYCFYCKLFSTLETQFTNDGFCDWKNAHVRLNDHEKSQCHLEAIYQFTMRSKYKSSIDKSLKKQVEAEKNYWKNLLERIISVIIFLVERNLPFRGENEVLGAPNNGNFLGTIELLSLYDDFLKNHLLKYANRGTGNVNYLSSKIVDELIEIMSEKLLNTIIENVKQSGYYSISVDSTTDVRHTDQLSLIVRYMENNLPVERFLTFLSNKGHTAQNIFDAIKTFFETHNIDLKKCRGQSYDNASVMRGEYNGLQALVIRENNLALFIPCFAHSLNLVGTAAMTCCLETKKFFDFLENIYVFFTNSTTRYDLLSQKLKEFSSENKNRILIPKRVSTTRWGSRAEAVQSVFQGYSVYRNVLQELSDQNDEANGLYKIILKLETGIYVTFWYDILESVNKTSIKLQSCDCDLNTSIVLLKSLKLFIESKRESFDHYQTLGKKISDCEEYEQQQKRVRRRNVRLNPLDYAKSPNVDLDSAAKFRVNCFIPIIDQMSMSLNQRIAAYEKVESYFGFLRKMHDLSNEEIKEHASKIVELYRNDLEEYLESELIQFKEFSKEFISDNDNEKGDKCFEAKMYDLIAEKKLQEVFPNVFILLKIYLVLMTTNCTSERSFSKLKIIKSRLRASMSQDKLNSTALMSIESDLLRKISYSDIIQEFSEKKSRRVLL